MTQTQMPLRRRRGARTSLRLALGVSLAAAMAVVAVPYAGAQQPRAHERSFFVSPKGSDTTGNGSRAHPWATMAKAQSYIRRHGLNRHMTGDIDVNLAPGRYYTSKTITFGPRDSGSNHHDIVYRSQGAAGSAHLIGGSPVSGWSRWSGHIYRTYVGTDRRFYTLYENGRRARVARYPNYQYNPEFPSAQAPYLRSEGVADSYSVLQYKKGDLQPAGWDLDDAQLYVWSGGHDWFADTDPIESINPATRQITLTHRTRYPLFQNGTGSRYYIQGALQLLDQAGEFYFDTSEGYLYYWPRHEAISKQAIVRPTVQRLVSVVGSSPSDRVHNIRFSGLSMQMTDFTGWYRSGMVDEGEQGPDACPAYDREIELARNRTGLMFLKNTDHVQIRRNHLSDAGFSAVYMLFANRHDTISGNLIDHAGMDGVFLQGRYPGTGNVLTDNVITNNAIHDVGELAGQAAGVQLMQAGRNIVSHSTIYDSPRYAVLISAVAAEWCNNDTTQADIYAKDNSVSFVRIHDVAQDSGDIGAVYAYGLSYNQPYLGNTYSQLVIRHVHADPLMGDYAPNGIFMDNGTYGQTFRNIDISDTEGTPFRANDSGDFDFVNVSWEPGFDPAKMKYDQIGVRNNFPYAVGKG